MRREPEPKVVASMERPPLDMEATLVGAAGSRVGVASAAGVSKAMSGRGWREAHPERKARATKMERVRFMGRIIGSLTPDRTAICQSKCNVSAHREEAWAS